MTQNTQIVQNFVSYINDLKLSYTSATTVTVATGKARDSNDVTDLVLSSGTVINTAVNGINGLDTGSLAVSTWYAVFIIGSSTLKSATGLIMSLSGTAPYLPFGYDSIRRLGWVLTDGSSNILNFYQSGNGSTRKYFWDALFTGLSGAGNTSYTAASLASYMPTTSQLVTLNWKFVPNTAGNLGLLRSTGSASTANIQVAGSVASQPNAGNVEINTNASQSIDYKTSSASDALTLYVVGFTDYV